MSRCLSDLSAAEQESAIRDALLNPFIVDGFMEPCTYPQGTVEKLVTLMLRESAGGPLWVAGDATSGPAFLNLVENPRIP